MERPRCFCYQTFQKRLIHLLEFEVLLHLRIKWYLLGVKKLFFLLQLTRQNLVIDGLDLLNMNMPLFLSVFSLGFGAVVLNLGIAPVD